MRKGKTSRGIGNTGDGVIFNKVVKEGKAYVFKEGN